MKHSNCLPSKDIQEAITLLGSLQETLIGDLDEGDKMLVSNWISNICLLNPALMLRPDALIEIGDSIFSSSEIRNYVLDLTFRFFSLAGNSDKFLQGLVFNLARGLTLDGPNPDYCLIPQELKQSMPTTLYPTGKQLSFWNRLLSVIGLYTPVTINDVLFNNKHLIVVFLIHISNTTKKQMED